MEKIAASINVWLYIGTVEGQSWKIGEGWEV